jgi:spermidine synthase
LSVVLLAALAAVIGLFAAGREKRRSRPAIAAGLIAASLLLVFSPGPTAAWRHSPIGAGRLEFPGATPNKLREWERTQRRQLRWEADGRESSVGILGLDLGLAFAVNGKVDGSAVGDSATQVMGGLVGAILHPLPKSALVVGLGTGSTAGWLGSVPSIERVDVVELEPAIRHVAQECAAVNRNVLENRRVRILSGDAREFLLTSRDRYDVIFSEPSNPYRAGISSLFTQDFYRAVRQRLAPGGIFVQWLQAYEVDSQTVRTAYATLASVFPSVETWFSKKQDLLLVSSDSAIRYPADALRARVQEEPYRSAMLDAWRVSDLEGFLSHFLARDSLARAIAHSEGGLVNTDDRNLMEFAFARSLGRSLFTSDDLWQVAQSRAEDRPSVEGSLDWDDVLRQRLGSYSAEGVEPASTGAPSVWDRRAPVFAHFAGGRLGEVARTFKADPWEPKGALEFAMIGESLADSGDERSLLLVRALDPIQPAEAAAIRARFLWTRSDWKGCFEATKTAFERYRTDPWPVPFLMKRLIAIAASLPSKDPQLAGPLDDLLSSRFSASLLDEDRALARLTIAQNRGAAAVGAAIQPLEPNFPWSGEFLQMRARAYEETNDPRAAAARREAQEFLSREAVPFNTGLSIPAK